MAVARKLFRLLKWFNEYVNIKKFISGDLPTIDKYLSVLTRLAFLFYWVFDNLGVLIKIKFIRGGLDPKNVLKRANRFWLMGLTLGIIHAFRNLMNVSADSANLLEQKATMDENRYKESLQKL